MTTNRVIILLDETGSMAGQEVRVVSGINEFMRSSRVDPETRVTLYLFDSERWRTYFDAPKREWIEMPVGAYRPGAMTPLYDSIARAVRQSEARPGDRVLVVIDTDGLENASKELTRLDQVKNLIERKKADGWEFIFFGTGIDRAASNNIGLQGQSLGVKTASFVHDSRSVAYTTLSDTTAAYFAGEGVGDLQSEIDSASSG